MPPTDLVAVVGSCAPERARYAARLAARTTATVQEYPGETSIVDIIGHLIDDDRVRLVGVTCVADAMHVLDDLCGDDPGAARLVAQLELASTIVLVNWTGIDTSQLSTVMALVGHLGPLARLRLDRGNLEPHEPVVVYEAEQERPGWIGILNDDFDPHMTDPRVSAFRYQNLRPFHPGRLQLLLDGPLDRGEFGTLMRSAGFCRLATRPQITAQWGHVGRMLSLSPLDDDDLLDDESELLALGQDLAIIGMDLDADALTAALDAAALNDAEFAAGPVYWAGFADPFPAWLTADDTAE